MSRCGYTTFPKGTVVAEALRPNTGIATLNGGAKDRDRTPSILARASQYLAFYIVGECLKIRVPPISRSLSAASTGWFASARKASGWL